MGYSARTSLRHQYEQYVEREIEVYKDRVSRSAILKIADDAVRRLCAAEQVTLNELVLCDEVDRIIAQRLRLPAFTTWARRRRRLIQERRHASVWGIDDNAAVVRLVVSRADDQRVLVAQPRAEGTPLFLAANGCHVTAVEPEADAFDRMVRSAEAAGFADRIEVLRSPLESLPPQRSLAAVVSSPAALAGLSESAQDRVMRTLQSATRSRGVHLFELFGARSGDQEIGELRRWYVGWDVSVEWGAEPADHAFVAVKP
jgi:hypothetical protein